MRIIEKNIFMSLIIIVILLHIPVHIDAAAPNVSSTNKLINQYFMDGLSFYLQRDFKNASELWQKVLELEPSHSRARIYFEKAFKKYQNMEINFYHGLKLYTEVKYREAIVFFKKALFVNPRHSKALYYT